MFTWLTFVVWLACLGACRDNILTCAFVTELPDSVRRALRSGSRMEAVTIHQLLERARAVLPDPGVSETAAAAGLANRRTLTATSD